MLLLCCFFFFLTLHSKGIRDLVCDRAVVSPKTTRFYKHKVIQNPRFQRPQSVHEDSKERSCRALRGGGVSLITYAIFKAVGDKILVVLQAAAAAAAAAIQMQTPKNRVPVLQGVADCKGCVLSAGPYLSTCSTLSKEGNSQPPSSHPSLSPPTCRTLSREQGHCDCLGLFLTDDHVLMIKTPKYLCYLDFCRYD